jgi:hypothetical protein
LVAVSEKAVLGVPIGLTNAGDICGLTDTPAAAVFPALADTDRVCVYDDASGLVVVD